MKYVFVSLLVVVAHCLWVETGLAEIGQGSESARPYNILILGDSISAGYGIEQEQGWVNLLNNRLLSQAALYRAINASISGDTTVGGLARLPQALERYHPTVVIIELGGNDGLRGYPISKIRANLDQLVQQSLDFGARVLVVGMRLPPNYGDRYANSFNQLFRDVASHHGIPLIPFMLDGIAINPELMQSDGIHPTAEAQPRLLELIWTQLLPLLESPIELPVTQPSH
jgi:acyl-CoA thioesterase-1